MSIYVEPRADYLSIFDIMLLLTVSSVCHIQGKTVA